MVWVIWLVEVVAHRFVPMITYDSSELSSFRGVPLMTTEFR